MLIPLVGFTEDGVPSLSVAASGEAADVPPLQVVRRLGIAAAQILWLPPALLDGAPGDAPPWWERGAPPPSHSHPLPLQSLS